MTDATLPEVTTSPSSECKVPVTEDGSLDGDDEVFMPNGNGHIYHERAAFLFNQPVKQPLPVNKKRCRSANTLKKRSRFFCILAIVVIVLGIGLALGIYFGLSPETPTSQTQAQNVTNKAYEPSKNGQWIHKKVPILQNFRSFWDPGDSRIFEATFANGTILKTFGHKSNDGSVASFYSVSISDGKGSETHVRFPGRRSFASVLLPDGGVVEYNWASEFHRLECKILLMPGTRSSRNEPLFHLRDINLGEFSSMFRELSTVIAGSFHRVHGEDGNYRCPLRLPLRVTKCGAGYSYEGAFIQGEITYENQQSVTVSALPWLDETNDCGVPSGNSMPNYYLPVSAPGSQATPTSSQPFCTSTSRAFSKLCSVVSHISRRAISAMCATVASRVAAGSSYSYVSSVVEESCHAIYNSFRLTCLALADKDIGKEEANPIHPVHLEKIIMERLCSEKSVMTPPHSHKKMTVTVMAFCPSASPTRSFAQTLDLTDKTIEVLQNMVHINCAGSPEVTYLYLGHAYTGASSTSIIMDRIEHRLQVCAICAFDMTLRVRVLDDAVCCNNTCKKDTVCLPEHTDPPTEEMTHTAHNSVYCHDFLSNFVTAASPISTSCLGRCDLRLRVHLQVLDSKNSILYYNQNFECDDNQARSCRKVIGT